MHALLLFLLSAVEGAVRLTAGGDADQLAETVLWQLQQVAAGGSQVAGSFQGAAQMTACGLSGGAQHLHAATGFDQRAEGQLLCAKPGKPQVLAWSFCCSPCNTQWQAPADMQGLILHGTTSEFA